MRIKGKMHNDHGWESRPSHPLSLNYVAFEHGCVYKAQETAPVVMDA